MSNLDEQIESFFSEDARKEMQKTLTSLEDRMARLRASRSEVRKKIFDTNNNIIEMYLKGKNYRQISEATGINLNKISRIIKGLMDAWKNEALLSIDYYKREQLEKINCMEAELWDAWAKSKQKAKTRNLQTFSGKYDTGNPERFRTEEETEVGHGDMEYMRGIQWCIDQRSKLLGLNVKKVAMTDSQGNDVGVTVEDVKAAVLNKIKKLTESKALLQEFQNKKLNDSMQKILPAKRQESSEDYVDAEYVEEEERKEEYLETTDNW